MNCVRKYARPLILSLALAPLPALAQQPPSSVGDEEPGSSTNLQPSFPTLEIGKTPASVIPDAGAKTLTLEEIIRRGEAVNGNTDIAILRERVIQAYNNVRRAWAVLLPQINAAATYTRNSTAAQIDFPIFEAGFGEVPNADGTGTILVPNQTVRVDIQPTNSLSAVAQASMPILLMPAYYGISAAKKGVEATEQSATFARNEIVLGIAQAYYGAVASRTLIEVSYAQVQVQTEQERVARARFEVGEVAKVDFLRAGVARTQAEQDLVRAQNAYVSTKLALQQLTGVSEPFDVVTPPPVETPSGDVDQLVKVGLENRKDLAASRTAIEIAKRTLQSNYWQFAPVISAEGVYQWSNATGFTGTNSIWLVSLTASLNIFDGGTRYANLRDARSQERVAREENIGLNRSVIQEVQTSLLNLETAQANLITAQEQVRLANESAELVQAQYEAGAATYLDVTDAYNARFASQVQVVNNELNVQVAALQLSRAIGRFGISHFP